MGPQYGFVKYAMTFSLHNYMVDKAESPAHIQAAAEGAGAPDVYVETIAAVLDRYADDIAFCGTAKIAEEISRALYRAHSRPSACRTSKAGNGRRLSPREIQEQRYLGSAGLVVHRTS